MKGAYFACPVYLLSTLTLAAITFELEIHVDLRTSYLTCILCPLRPFKLYQVQLLCDLDCDLYAKNISSGFVVARVGNVSQTLLVLCLK